MITEQKMMLHVYHLTDSLLQGRETGTPGGVVACTYLVDRFKEYGLHPLGTGNPKSHNHSYIQGFTCTENRRGRNVVGWIPADTPASNEYLIISAHYDHLGVINGTLYPGADSNASGVAVLLTLANALGKMKKEGAPITRNVVFVAYDAKEFSMTGAQIFATLLKVPPAQICLNMNLDQLGTTLAPPSNSENYVLVLGADTLPPHILRSLNNSNAYYNTGLTIDYSFYNSPSFADIYFSMTEQSVLAQLKVPSLLITSGVHENTYKPTDAPDILHPPLLKKRTEWLFFVLWDLVQRW
ncbi:MAG: M28 family peptidase [Bacteroidales bacterium]|nr:M28 family peptidase [Bacteroidales bacterium]